jgi:aminopeptidase N
VRDFARVARDPLMKQTLYDTLALVQDPMLAGQVLQLAITDEAGSNSAGRLVGRVATVHPELAWRFTLANLPEINRSLETLSRSTFVPRVAGESSDPAVAEELIAYAAKNIPADAQGEVKVALANIREHAAIRGTRLPQIDGWIAERAK